MKYSKQRNLVLDTVNNRFDHPSAYEVYKSVEKILPNISLGTVYRNLNILSNNKMINRFIVNGVERFDNCKIKHDHFVCYRCNQVLDVFLKHDFKDYVDGNLVTDYCFVLNGICQKCLKEEK